MSQVQLDASADQTSVSTVKQVFRRWERWRVAYNLALVGLVIASAIAWGDGNSNWTRLAWECVFGAIFANLCYFAGPAADAYLRWLGVNNRVIAPFLFGCGLLFTMALASFTVRTSLLSQF